MLGREREGIDLYRLSFLNDPQNLSFSYLRYQPILDLLEKAKIYPIEKKNGKRLSLFLPGEKGCSVSQEKKTQ